MLLEQSMKGKTSIYNTPDQSTKFIHLKGSGIICNNHRAGNIDSVVLIYHGPNEQNRCLCLNKCITGGWKKSVVPEDLLR